MKVFLTRTLTFLFYSICIYILCLLVFGELIPINFTTNLRYLDNGGGFLKTRLREVPSIGKVDVLILGSSHAYRGYDPRIFNEFGLSMFNLGSSAQTFLQTRELLFTYYDSLDPDIVILDVYPALFQSDGIESTLDFISSSNLDLWNLVREQNNITLYNTYLFSLYKKCCGISEPIENNTVPSDKYISGGYVESSLSNFSDEVLNKSLITPQKKQIEAYKSIVEFLNARKQLFVVVQSPTTFRKNESFENIEDLDSIFHDVDTYLNYNKILELQDDFFLDNSHLNQKGVDIFNRTLIKNLDSLNIIKYK